MEIADLRFLVVEDHQFQRWMEANLLEGLGAQYVFSAADGQEALNLIEGREPPIDVILTDLDMPGMDGMQFIRHLAEAKYPAALIVASSMATPLVASVETMARAYGVKLLGAISKPLTAKKLKALLDLYDTTTATRDQVQLPKFDAKDIAEGLKNGEFEPFFQPKVESATQITTGAEALARWRNPRQRVFRPQAFIEIMEESGLIDSLTQVMVRGAARNCRTWREAGLDVSVSINLSLKSLRDVTLADRLAQIIREEDVEPDRVIFEVTESAAAGDVGRTLENLSRLRMKGFGLSIDDYGTGYSSMERLTNMPFTELKIDQSFVQHAATRPTSRAVLESSLEMAGKLGIVAVAEGVENRSEWDLVRSLGCKLAQGYFIARPMEAGEFLDWARAHAVTPGGADLEARR
jgi:EAL domain-containing protein (putative c-di-GMP-specific phosphodiesterase class I)/CheY-like chemotaxis protein